MKCGGPRHGSEKCSKIYECNFCGVVEKFTLHLLIQHMVVAHQKGLWKKQFRSKCYEISGEKSVTEKVKRNMLMWTSIKLRTVYAAIARRNLVGKVWEIIWPQFTKYENITYLSKK